LPQEEPAVGGSSLGWRTTTLSAASESGIPCKIRHVASVENLTAYLEKLRSAHIGPSRRINKLEIFKCAAQYTKSTIPEQPSEEEKHPRC